MLRAPILRNILLLSFIITIFYPFFAIFFINPAFKNLLIQNTEEDAIRVATHLSTSIQTDGALSALSFQTDLFKTEIMLVKESFSLERLKIFSTEGKVLFSTDEKEIGQLNQQAYFSAIIVEGTVFTQLVRKNKASREDRIINQDVVEVYVPLKYKNRIVGAVEIYYDITNKMARLKALVWESVFSSVVVAIAFMLVVSLVLMKASRAFLDRDQAETALKAMNEELEQRVSVRTLDLGNANRDLKAEIVERNNAELRLKDAKHQAELANRAKSEFLANISHELRTPMHGILSFAKLGIKRVTRMSKKDVADYFNEIHNSGQRLLFLLNDLLDLSKLESGKTNLEMEMNSVPEIVRLAISEYQCLINEKQLQLKLNLPEIPTQVECDKYKIGQVVRNLLSNAIKFTPDGEEIDISFETTTMMSGRRDTDSFATSALKVIVRDNGVGIPYEELNTVFDKFIQSSKTKNGNAGTGLGLAICKQIIDSHLGKIWALPNPKGGSIFQFAIPYRQKNEPLA